MVRLTLNSSLIVKYKRVATESPPQHQLLKLRRRIEPQYVKRKLSSGVNVGENMALAPNEQSARGATAITKPVKCGDGGLYLVVEKSGANRWAFLYRRDGTLREMGLGGLKSFMQARAREFSGEPRVNLQ